MSDRLSILDKVRKYISDSTFADKTKITDEILIFREGFLDSMGFVSIITFLENDFGIAINEVDLAEENFESINAIVSFIMTKKAA